MVADPVVLLADADVIVDYRDSDRQILELVGHHLGRMRVLPSAHDVLDGQPAVAVPERIPPGVEVVDVDPAQVLRAVEVQRNLSFNERLCVVICRERGWTCVTNDGALRRFCERHGVETRFGLNLLMELVAAGAITRKRAEAVARRIHASNPWQINDRVLATFFSSLNAVMLV